MNKYIKIIPKTVKNFLKEYQRAAERSAMHTLMFDVAVIDSKKRD